MFSAALLLFLTAQPASSAAPPVVVVSGCLTSTSVQGHDEFTLTARDTNRAAADVKTETYRLTPSGKVDLKSLVGKRVEVTGSESTVGAEATTVDSTRTAESPAGTSGRTPTVETKTRADIVVHQMTVTSAKPVTGDCRVP